MNLDFQRLRFSPGWPRRLFKNLGRAGLAVLVALTITLVLLPFRRTFSSATIELVYLLPVLVGTLLWGLSAGIVAATAAFLAYNYFFISPYYSLRVHRPQDILALLIFLAVAILISQLIGQARAEQTAARARENELAHLYELSAALASQSHLQDLAQALAAHSLETLQAAYTEMYVSGSPPFATHAPAGAPRPAEPPQAIFALQTARGLLGEVRIWRARPLDPAEERRLRAFAVQGALALERAALSQAESRAQVSEESDRMKTALLSSVSHDLRTPLATIKASVTSLLSGEVDWDLAARQDLLSAIDEETDHLNHLVGNLLAMSRIEAGALRPNRQWNLLSEIIDGVLAHQRRRLDSRRVALDIPEDLPLVPVDYVQLEQVFTNLIGNSLKYAPPDTTIAISARALPAENVVQVQVANQGPPVAPEDLERIFDKFYRLTNAERITGTGLGLSICKGIIEAHGGRIWAENLPPQPGKPGFAFHFTLPLSLGGAAPPVVQSEL